MNGTVLSCDSSIHFAEAAAMVFLRRSSAFVIAGALAGVLPSLARGGTASATAHAHDYSPVLENIASPTMTHATLATVDTLNVNSLGAHSRAWAAAAVVSGTLRKSTGGEGWYMNGASPKHQYWSASAGTGTYFLTAPPGVIQVPLQIRILETGNPEAIDPGIPPIIPPEVGEYPSQGFFAENLFDVFFNIESSSVIGPVAMGSTATSQLAPIIQRP
jgi:hypothetical protein